MSDTPLIPPALTPDEWDEFKRAQSLHADTVVQTRARHTVAALCLHEQDFGFTHADLILLDNAAGMIRDEFGVSGEPDKVALLALAARIAALLPPSSPESHAPQT